MGAAAPALISGGLSFLGARKQAKAAGQAGKAADPFAPYRQQYGDLLSKLYGFPTLAEQQAGRQAGQQGGEAPSQLTVKVRGRDIPIEEALRQEALGKDTGYTRNELIALQDLGEQVGLAPQRAPAVPSEESPEAFTSDFIMNLPGLRQAIDESTKATSRAAAARGLGRSGNVLSEISQRTAGIVQGRAGRELDRIAQLAGAGAVGGGAPYIVEAGAARAQPLTDLGALLGRYGTGGFGGGGSLTGATAGVPNLSTAGTMDIFGSPDLSL